MERPIRVGIYGLFFFFQRSVLARAHEISKYTAFMLENSGKYLLKTYCWLHQALL